MQLLSYVKKLTINGEECHVVTPELIEEYIMLKESNRRQDNLRKVCSKQRALEILGCSESTLYRKLRHRNTKIKKGAVNGTYLIKSLYQELEK